MPKRTLTPQEMHLLRDELQRATLAALMASRRWKAGDLAFQGGTSLHLVHGSVRFSEDLDFMIRGGLSLEGLARAVEAGIDTSGRNLIGLNLRVSVGRAGRNPHSFDVTLSSPDVLGSVRVKVELWQTPASVMDGLALVVTPVVTSAGRQVAVPALTREEILADKVYALGARDRIKARDIYDLWWLGQGGQPARLDPELLGRRLEIYPQGDVCTTARWWIDRAVERLQLLDLAATARAVAADLRRWLPPSAAPDDEGVQEMVRAAQVQLRQGIDEMASLEERLCEDEDDASGSRPRG